MEIILRVLGGLEASAVQAGRWWPGWRGLVDGSIASVALRVAL